MKQFILFSLLLTALSTRAKTSYIKIKQKNYPSLCTKNFLLISGEVEFPISSWHYYSGTIEDYAFRLSVNPEQIRDFVDRYYKFEKKTILFLNPRGKAQANILSVQKDTIFFQFKNSIYKKHAYNFTNADFGNAFCLLDFAILHPQDINSLQQFCAIKGEFPSDYDTLLSIPEDKVLEILKNNAHQKKYESFLHETKKYFTNFKYPEWAISYFLNSKYISCYMQNDTLHFFNKRTSRVFIKLKEIKQFTGCGTTNYLINHENGPIYHYNALTDSLAVFMKADYFDKFIRIDSNKINDPFVISGRYRNPPGKYTDDYNRRLPLMGSVSNFDRQYVYQDSNKLPVFTKIHYYYEPSKMKPAVKSKTYPIWFVYFALVFNTAIAFLFLKINLQKKQ